MTTSGDVWAELGELNDEDAVHTLSRLFVMYEEQQQRNPDDEAVISRTRGKVQELVNAFPLYTKRLEVYEKILGLK